MLFRCIFHILWSNERLYYGVWLKTRGRKRKEGYIVNLNEFSGSIIRKQKRKSTEIKNKFIFAFTKNKPHLIYIHFSPEHYLMFQT